MRNHDDGFTLVELLVGITVMAVIGGAVMTSVVRSLQVSTATTARVEALTSLQIAQERMSRTIRGADPLSLPTANSLRLTHYVEIDGCTVTQTNDCLRREVVTYTKTADTITRSGTTYTNSYGTTVLGTSSTEVIDGLDTTATTTFAYFDELGQVWDGVSASDIRQVQITLRHDMTDVPDLVLTTSVFLRNSRVAIST